MIPTSSLPNQTRLATFGFRSIPPCEGCAGSDKFAEELLVRLVRLGFIVTAYTRIYRHGGDQPGTYAGIRLVHLTTVKRKGFDTLLHSLKATLHIIVHNTGTIVHVHNGGNSIWALLLRLAGKRVVVTQDGIDWDRNKWPWYGRLFLHASAFVTAKVPNHVVFDNVFVKEEFEKRYRRTYNFIPYGSECEQVDDNTSVVMNRLGLTPRGYMLFVGRFIPDKGLHYLVSAFERLGTDKRLVLVGGSPNPSAYESQIRSTKDSRILFPGYIYGKDTVVLMKNAYLYVQPSDIEGLSPVILSAMSLGTPLLCSDIRENMYVVGDTALTFRRSDTDDLARKLEYALLHSDELIQNTVRARHRALEQFSWDVVVRQYADLFRSAT